ncbi:MAG TPA: S41 family peptidase [Cyclobacteriaceae bacterium]|nr:S41 family peptidase [Cyclobacteriaceae bacterium]
MKRSTLSSLCALLMATMALPGIAQDTKLPAMNAKQTRLLIDSISNALHRYYIYPDEARIMGDYLKSQFKKGAYARITNPFELGDQLRKDLQKVHRDPHMGVRYDPRFAIEQAGDTLLLKDRRNEETAFLKKRNFFFDQVQILEGNIGYLKFDGFTGRIADANPTLHSAMTFLRHTDAMIIDLRQNHGGDPEMVRQIESYFFKTRTHMMDIVDRPARTTHTLWADPADVDSLTFTGPVYILTSKGTFSGAEDFSYGMQSVKRATIVGDTTGGGAHPTDSYNIGQGFVANIPFARSLNPYTNTDWEGTGVRPDIAVPADQALEKAQEIYFVKQLAAATNQQERENFQWKINHLKAISNDQTISPETLQRYSGVYEGGLDFYVSNGRFYCKNAERNNELFQLKAVSSTLFLLDENVIVEFLKDASGNYSSLNMLWNGGGVSSKRKVE